jgi:polyribonucleotide nucleotidyltransferase
MATAEFNLEQSIQERISEATRERRALKESLDSIQAKFDGLVSRLRDKPRESDADLVKAIKGLEFWHSTNTQDNASERKFMQDMDKLRKKRVALVEFAEIQESIDEIKHKRKEMQAQLREKEQNLDELHQALRKMKTASKVGCDAGDVIEQLVVAPEDKVPVSAFRQLSDRFQVNLTSGRVGGNRAVRVQGLPADVAAAVERIQDMLDTVSTEVKVTAGTVFCLLMASGTLIRRIEESSNVRIDLSRSNLTCKVIGKPNDVSEGISEIQSIQSATAHVPFDSSALPAILGRGGLSLRAIEQEHSVNIDVDREKSVLSISGFVDDVEAAKELVRSVADENKQLEEIMKVPRHVFLGCLLKDSGAVLRDARKEYPSVQISTLKPDGTTDATPLGHAASATATAAASGPSKSKASSAAAGVSSTAANGGAAAAKSRPAANAVELLVLKGPAGRVLGAVAFLRRATDEYLKHITTVIVPKDSISYVVGRKGARIDAMRKGHTGATVDIECEAVHIYASSEAVRNAIRHEILEVVAENQVHELTFEEETLKVLLGAKGASTRALIQDSLDINMSVDVEAGEVKLRGRQAAIEQATSALKAFEAANACVELAATDEDCSALAGGGETSSAREFETRFGVEIYVGRKQHVVKVRGPQEAVNAAAAAIKRLLHGEAGSESQLMAVDPEDFRILIGRNGETIAKLEKDNNVSIDVLKSAGKVRVRGTNATEVSEAVLRIATFLGDVADILRVPVPDDTPKEQLKTHISTVVEIFHVKVLPPARKDTGKKTEEGEEAEPQRVSLQGKRRVLKLAAKYLSGLLSGVEQYTLVMPASIYRDVHPQLSSPSRVAAFEKHNVRLSFDSNHHSVKLDGGDSSQTTQCKVMLFRALDELAPGRFASVPLKPGCLSHFVTSHLEKAIGESTGTLIDYDFPFSSCRICGPPANVLEAADRIHERATEWSSRHIVIELSDSSVIPYILGKAGAFINSVRKQTAADITIDDINKAVIVEGGSASVAESAAQRIRDRVRQYEAENWSIHKADREALSYLIGKAGAKINALRTETGADVNVDLNTGVIRVRYYHHVFIHSFISFFFLL